MLTQNFSFFPHAPPHPSSARKVLCSHTYSKSIREQVIFWVHWDTQWENVRVQCTQQIVFKMQPNLCPEKTSILYWFFPLSEKNFSPLWNRQEGEGGDERKKQITGCGQGYTHYIERTWKALLKLPTSVQCIYKDSNKSHRAEQPEGALCLCNLMALCSLKSKSSSGFGRVPGQTPHGSQD